MKPHALLIALPLVTGCHLFLEVDDTTEVATAEVTVRAEGVIEPVTVRLIAPDVDEPMVIAADGAHTFTRPVSPTYAVTVAGGAPCALGGNAAGAVDGLEVTVALVCVGATRLDALTVESLTATQPALVGGTTTYQVAVSELQQTTRIAATPHSPDATLTVDGVAVPAGTASGPVSLAGGSRTVAIAVDHPLSQALRTSYAITVERGLPAAHVATGTAPAPSPFDQLGWAVATDGRRYVAGVPNEDSGTDPSNPADAAAPGSGAAYVYARQGTTWTREGFVKAPNAGADDSFGHTVAIDGDRLAVSALFEDSGSTNMADDTVSNAGAVYVYRREAGAWVFEQYLKSPHPRVDGYFGYALALDGDTLAIGAYNEDQYDGATLVNPFAGQVHVFRRTGTTWALEASLGPDRVGGAGDQLGYAVALQGDLLIAGAISGHPTVSAAGAARVYTRSGASWRFEAQLVASDASRHDFFGESVAVDGDTAVVTASMPITPDGQQTSLLPGAAYVFTRDGTGWRERQKLTAPNAGPDDELGREVALAGDLIAVSAFREDGPGTGVTSPSTLDTATEAGAVYLYERGADGTWTFARYLKSPQSEAGDLFGISLALAPDGVLVVGASGDDRDDRGEAGNNNVSGAGACFVLH